jgi:hypothetical protein
LLEINCTPGPDNSILIKTDNEVPTTPANNAKIIYNTPISFALLDHNHLSSHMALLECCSFCVSRLKSEYIFEGELCIPLTKDKLLIVDLNRAISVTERDL